MNLRVPNPARGYSLDIQPLTGRVTALRDDLVIATSTRARVMYETRAPAVIYFPAEDVVAPLGPKTALQTFCPFKGTATYHDLRLGDVTVPNGVWSYEASLSESEGIRGYVGFMPGAITDTDLGDNILRDDPQGHISGPLIDWLLREAAALPSPEDFTQALTGKLRENGVAISRCSVMIWSLHPLIAGKNYVWTKAQGTVSTYAPSYEIFDHPAFVNSPLRHVSNGLGGVRQKLGADYADNSFPIIEDLRAQGATDYVAMPMPFSDGRTNVLALTCDHPDGFTTENLGLIFECSAVISRFYEVFMQRENAQSLLETYLGKRSGARVLGGQIRRGDGDEIDAAIMFCDMRHSTRLAESLGRADYLARLNRFFETTSTIVQDHGGEVLKFIGDAVLAVFPAGTDPAQACGQALTAARAMPAALAAQDTGERSETAIGIAFGRVTYGNVGSRERLDFTVIGQAANVAARLCDYGKTVGSNVVVTGEVAAASGAQPGLSDLGAVQLHNVSVPVRAYGLTTA